MRHTKAAQRFINCKNTTEKLELLLFANFDSPLACFVTLTYDGSHLPRSKAAAKANMAKVKEGMRCEKRKRGEPLPYMYTAEGAAQAYAHIACCDQCAERFAGLFDQITKGEAEALIAAWVTGERTALSVVRPKGA